MIAANKGLLCKFFLFLWLNKGLIQRASKDCGLLVVIVNKKEWDIKAYLNTFNLD